MSYQDKSKKKQEAINKKLQQLEVEVEREFNKNKPGGLAYSRRKQPQQDSSLKLSSKKLIKIGTFCICVVGGIALVQAGFLLGLWLARLFIAGIIAAIAYSILMEDSG